MPDVAERDIPLEYLHVGKVKKEAALDKALDKAVKSARNGKAAKKPIAIKALPTSAQFTSTGKKKPPIEQIDLAQVKKIQRSSLNGKVVVAAVSEDKKTSYRLVAMRFTSPEAFEKGLQALKPETLTAPSALPSPTRGGDSNRQQSPISNVKQQFRPVSRQMSPERSSKRHNDTTTGIGRKTPARARMASISSTTRSPLSLTHRGTSMGGYHRRPESTKSSRNDDYRKWPSAVNMGHTKTTYISTDFIFSPSGELPTEEMLPPVPRSYAITYVASHQTPAGYTPDSLLTSTPSAPPSLIEQQRVEQSPFGNTSTVSSYNNQYTNMQDVQHLQKKRQLPSDNNSFHRKLSVESRGSHNQSEDLSNRISGAEYNSKSWRQIPPDKAPRPRVPHANSINSSRTLSDGSLGTCRIIYPSKTSAKSIRRSRSHNRRPSVHRIELVDEEDIRESGAAKNYSCKSEGRRNRSSSRRRWIKQPISSSSCSACGSSIWQCRRRSGSFASDATSTDRFEYMEADCPRGIIKLYYRPSQSVH
ncbi:unnamed protein product [Dibothriocephalus latus]|uniref:DUF5734 domain-containing protein n=1 Tax=Dibothriocephalus latus TaxID=60516 RepID=A0A3P6SH44_DIBLA|nr:unnamed protein product [Dibothriocephalus latus]